MQKNNWTFLLIFSLSIHLASAEQTGGTCYLKEEIKGQDVMEIYSEVKFYTKPEGKLFQKIWIDAYVQTSKLYDGLRLEPKTKLYSNLRKPIGKILVSFNPMKLLETRDSMTHIQITGYLENACIDKRFIPETELSAILLGASTNAKLDLFKTYLAKFNFQEWLEEKKYTSYLIYEPDFVRQTLNPRILMIFFNGELIAIFHTRDVSAKLYDSIEMGSQYKMIYNSKYTEHTKSEMVTIYKNKIEQAR